MKIFILKSLSVLFVLTFIAAHHAHSQADWRNWDGVSIDLNMDKKATIGLDHLRSYQISNSFKNNLNQTSLTFDYDITRRLTAKAGITFSEYPASNKTTERYYVRGSYKVPLGKIFRWSNGLQVETYSANETRFDYRLIYITRLGTRNRIKFLRLSPSISYWLYYNIGGNTIQYYDKSGLPVVRQTPDGFHRGRLIVNLNSKISNNLSVSLYYINQNEFNLFTEQNRDINVVNPVTGKISRPFDDYEVVGVNFKFDFDLYKKRK